MWVHFSFSKHGGVQPWRIRKESVLNFSNMLCVCVCVWSMLDFGSGGLSDLWSFTWWNVSLTCSLITQSPCITCSPVIAWSDSRMHIKAYSIGCRQCMRAGPRRYCVTPLQGNGHNDVTVLAFVLVSSLFHQLPVSHQIILVDLLLILLHFNRRYCCLFHSDCSTGFWTMVRKSWTLNVTIWFSWCCLCLCRCWMHGLCHF